ncbi:MAG: RNA polymerase sigma-70 factor, partial [Chloroflexota bacterium]
MIDHATTFDEYRSYLFSVAYRMLGSAMEAEDMVQETFLRWQKVTEDKIESVKAYLTTIITRLCLDHLRSAKVQRENYVGAWLPEPLVSEQVPDPEDNVDLAESLSIAFLILLESLTPTERAVFLLREVFDYDYVDVARIVNKTEANCRQMVRRARQHITARRPRFDPDPAAQEKLLLQFMEACLSGDMPGLLTLLADDITFRSDGGGQINSALNPIYGADKVSRFLFGVLKKVPDGLTPHLARVNNRPGVISYV